MNFTSVVTRLVDGDKGIKSASDFSRKVNISRQTANLILSGKIKNPKQETLQKIASYFNCSSSYLLGVKDGFSLKEELKVILSEKGIGVSELSKKSGVDRTVIYSILRGDTRVMREANLRKISVFLNVSLDRLQGSGLS